MPSPLMYAHGYSVKVYVTTCDRKPSYLYQTRQSLARWGIAHDVLFDSDGLGSAGIFGHVFNIHSMNCEQSDYVLVLDDDVEWQDWFGNCLPENPGDAVWSLFSFHNRSEDLTLPIATVEDRTRIKSGGCALMVPSRFSLHGQHGGSEKTAKVALAAHQQGMQFKLFHRNAVKHIGDVSAAHPGIIWSQVEHLMVDL